jgi:predicted dehydrogenase
LIDGGWLGELRHVQLMGLNGSLADPNAPLSWRQDAQLSGVNMLTLGILHETLLRWAPLPLRVSAQSHCFIPERLDPEKNAPRHVGTPDSVQVIAALQGGAKAVYHFSGVTPFGQEQSIALYGSDGVLHYDLGTDRISGASRREGPHVAGAPKGELRPIPIPPDKEGGWNVEADFVASIREGKPVTRTDFTTGLHYMAFTDAVVRSAAAQCSVVIAPLEH